MKAINAFTLCTAFMFILNFALYHLVGVELLSVEANVIAGFAITWCFFEDNK